ncbi:MAG TPA: 2-dehydropantoate 2-reductase N-terminal domain-containing protein, partial [Bacillota bacterium]|nr:2-dehydropantoate 2-reductase N-terminal domain-containing protein [Bacillota bacterium]
MGEDNVKKTVTVCGAGSWGTALAIVLADNGYQVNLWTHRKEQADEINQFHTNEKYLQVKLPKNIEAYTDIEQSVKNTTAIVLVVPTKAIREVSRKLNPYIHKQLPLIHASKGIEPKTLKRVSEMIAEELDHYDYRNITVLSGPSHAEEVAKRQPTTVTVSALNKEQAKFAQNLFFNSTFRVYTSSDVIGI